MKFDFSANISPLGTPNEITNSIRISAENVLSYPDPFCTELRAEIAKNYNVARDNIMCGNGAADLIFGFSLALKPKKALIVSPTFCEYENALKSVDCEIKHYLLKECNDFQLRENILQEITDEIDVIFICNPNNPTGKFYQLSLMKKIANKCKSTGTLMFIDECFFDLTGKSFENSAINLLYNDRIFVLKAFTKSYGMAGVRLGYLLSENSDLLLKMSEVMQCWNVSTLAQNAGVTALKHCNSHIENSLRVIKAEKEYLEEELSNLNINYFKSDANFFLIKSEIDLYSKLFEKEILIRKCGNFLGLDDNFYRIAVKNHNENLALIKALKEIITNG